MLTYLAYLLIYYLLPTCETIHANICGCPVQMFGPESCADHSGDDGCINILSGVPMTLILLKTERKDLLYVLLSLIVFAQGKATW